MSWSSTASAYIDVYSAQAPFFTRVRSFIWLRRAFLKTTTFSLEKFVTFSQVSIVHTSTLTTHLIMYIFRLCFAVRISS